MVPATPFDSEEISLKILHYCMNFMSLDDSNKIRKRATSEKKKINNDYAADDDATSDSQKTNAEIVIADATYKPLNVHLLQ